MESDEKAVIRKNIRLFRQQLGLSQAQLAQLVGVPKDTVSKWEQPGPEGVGALRSPDPLYLRRLAACFGRSIDDFFEPKPPPPKTERRLEDLRVEQAFKALKAELPQLARELEDFERRCRKELEAVIAVKSPGKRK